MRRALATAVALLAAAPAAGAQAGTMAVATPGADARVLAERSADAGGIDWHVRVDEVEGPPQSSSDARWVRIRVAARRGADGGALRDVPIGAWVDFERTVGSDTATCAERVSRYLRSGTVDRALSDLNGYHVLTLDREASITVLDPSVSFAGRTSQIARIALPSPGFDWARTRDDFRLFVVSPGTGAVTLVDLQSLRVIAERRVDGEPTRVALQPDDRVAWVGHQDPQTGRSALTGFDALTGAPLATLPLPHGYLDVAFSSDSRIAWVTSRQAGTVSVVDLETRRVIAQHGGLSTPVGVVTVPGDERGAWVTVAGSGELVRVDRAARISDRIPLDRGVAPAKLAPDGSTLWVPSPFQQAVRLVDAKSRVLSASVTISGQPYDVAFSEEYAYVRGLASGNVALVSLRTTGASPSVQQIPAGAIAPRDSGDLPRASMLAVAAGDRGAFIASPGESAVYYYMEGMNAPSSGLRVRGSVPLAVLSTRRGLREIERGTYEATVPLPARGGRFVVATALDAPVIRECVAFELPEPAATPAAWGLHWLEEPVVRGRAGAGMRFRFRSTGGAARAPFALHARAVSSRGDSVDLAVATVATVASESVYEVTGRLPRAGTYFVHVARDDAEAGRDAVRMPTLSVIID